MKHTYCKKYGSYIRNFNNINQTNVISPYLILVIEQQSSLNLNSDLITTFTYVPVLEIRNGKFLRISNTELRSHGYFLALFI